MAQNRTVVRKAPASKSSSKAVINEQQRIELIRARANEIFRARITNNVPGDEYSDWEQAEQELSAQFALKV